MVPQELLQRATAQLPRLCQGPGKGSYSSAQPSVAQGSLVTAQATVGGGGPWIATPTPQSCVYQLAHALSAPH